MSNVEAEFGAWLRLSNLVARATSDELAALWEGVAATGSVVSALADKNDAEVEAARQISLFGAPLVIDMMQVAGLRLDLFARPVTLQATRAGYEGGVTVFVIGVKEMDQVEMTNLTVLRKLT